jgi:hypothetical protein
MTATPTASRGDATDAGWTTAHGEKVLAMKARLLESLESPREAQREVLDEALAANSETAFGREHSLAAVTDVDSFRRAVPIRDYAAFAPWIERAAAGEHNVLTAEEPLLFFTSSGSTGTAKTIPVTAPFVRRCYATLLHAALVNPVEHYESALLRPDATLNLKNDPIAAPPRTESGRPQMGASQLDYGAFGAALTIEPGSRAPWSVLPAEHQNADALERSYLRLRLAVEHDVRFLLGLNPAMVAALPWQLAEWAPRILKEVRDGTLGGVRHGSPNRARARELERLAEHFGQLLPLHVWPRMEVMISWKTGIAALYLPRVQQLFGPRVRLLPGPVAASEAPIAVPLDRHPTAGPLLVSSVFFEFVEADEDLAPDSPTQLFDELEVDREYHVILSHVGGFYRYALGDVVRVVGRVRAVPRVEYAGRSTLSSAAGERLRDAHVVRALGRSLDLAGGEVRNAACRCVDDRPEGRGYDFALAPQDTLTRAEADALAPVLDAQLCEVASGYRSARESGGLGPVRVHPVAPDAFQREWVARVRAGSRPTQVKDRVFERDDEAWRRILATG